MLKFLTVTMLGLGMLPVLVAPSASYARNLSEFNLSESKILTAGDKKVVSNSQGSNLVKREREFKFTQSEWKQHLKDLKAKKRKSTLSASPENLKSFKVQGPGTSGGGNNYESEFFYLGTQVMKEILTVESGSAVSKAISDSFDRLRSEEALFFTEDKLFLGDKEKTAINDYEVFVVIINKALWDSSTFFQKRQIIVHELLGLAKSFDPTLDDSRYEISSQIFKKLQKDQQKVFLLNSDYPKRFDPPFLQSQRFEGNKISYKTRGSQDNCNSETSKLSIDLKMIQNQENPKMEVAFEIICLMADGKVYSHREGGDGDDILEIASQNLLEMNTEFGSFLLGWISGKDLLIRSPFQLLTLKKNSDGTFSVRFEFYKNKDAVSYEFFEATVQPINLR